MRLYFSLYFVGVAQRQTSSAANANIRIVLPYVFWIVSPVRPPKNRDFISHLTFDTMINASELWIVTVNLNENKLVIQSRLRWAILTVIHTYLLTYAGMFVWLEKFLDLILALLLFQHSKSTETVKAARRMCGCQ